MAIEVGDNPAGIVPVTVKIPVVELMLYIETSFEPEFVTYAKLPEGSIANEFGPDPAGIVPTDINLPVLESMEYIEMSFEPELGREEVRMKM
jgi:hypothetical protein